MAGSCTASTEASTWRRSSLPPPRLLPGRDRLADLDRRRSAALPRRSSSPTRRSREPCNTPRSSSAGASTKFTEALFHFVPPRARLPHRRRTRSRTSGPALRRRRARRKSEVRTQGHDGGRSREPDDGAAHLCPAAGRRRRARGRERFPRFRAQRQRRRQQLVQLAKQRDDVPDHVRRFVDAHHDGPGPERADRNRHPQRQQGRRHRQRGAQRPEQHRRQQVELEGIQDGRRASGVRRARHQRHDPARPERQLGRQGRAREWWLGIRRRRQQPLWAVRLRGRLRGPRAERQRGGGRRRGRTVR